MERHGWRAIIYDAPWARFKPGQEGVIISEDGKSCETVSDEKPDVIIETIPNTSLDNRDNGHILFRQKGSDLFDIVCLTQDVGGKYSLKVDPVTIDVCSNVSYENFINKLIIYEIINDVKRKITDNQEKKKFLKKPTVNDYKNDTVGTYTIEIASGDTIATSILNVIGDEDEHDEYSPDDTIISVTEENFITKKSDEARSCSISIISGNVNGDCIGGKVVFNNESTILANATYLIDLNNIHVKELGDTYKCGRIVSTERLERDGVIENAYLIPKSGVSVLNATSSSIKISVTNGISSVEIIIETGLGYKETISIPIPS